jgi:hypothetical protein
MGEVTEELRRSLASTAKGPSVIESMPMLAPDGGREAPSGAIDR